MQCIRVRFAHRDRVQAYRPHCKFTDEWELAATAFKAMRRGAGGSAVSSPATGSSREGAAEVDAEAGEGQQQVQAVAGRGGGGGLARHRGGGVTARRQLGGGPWARQRQSSCSESQPDTHGNIPFPIYSTSKFKIFKQKTFFFVRKNLEGEVQSKLPFLKN